MNIIYATTYQYLNKKTGQKSYDTFYTILNQKHYGAELTIDEAAGSLAQQFCKDNEEECITIHNHRRAQVNGSVTGKMDGGINFELVIDGQNIFS